MIEIDFIRSDIFEEVLNYMYTAKISVKKRDVNLMMSSGQILGIRFLDKLCSQVTLTQVTPTQVTLTQVPSNTCNTQVTKVTPEHTCRR